MKRIAVLLCLSLLAFPANAEFRAGAAAVNVTPTHLPVIQNGGFVERSVRLVADPIFARAIVLEQKEKIAIVVVDSCMMDREFCDRVKAAASEKTGIARDRILLSATHTHSAPSVMDYCLGSRKDPKYSEYLPGKIVEAIVKANASLRPAKVAATRFDAGDYTKTRRWSFRAGKEKTDPFGERTVRANMHPGHLNPDAIGETGPTDPWFTLLSIRDSEDRPLALLGNFSMHYFSGHAGVSADYFGYYVRAISEMLAPGDAGFVGILSQGTSGDLWRGDYSKARPERDLRIQEYAGQLAELSAAALKEAPYSTDVPLAMAEARLTIGRRTPDGKRLEWAREVLAKMGDRRPANQQEVYAEQALYIHRNPSAEVVLQAVRIGDLAMTAMPNEVYGLTGLKLKYQSPLPLTMNVELANGASGYIPPPEQFPLGGYNTWPARTAGLIPGAEPRIVESVLSLLEKVAGKPRRAYEEPESEYAKAVKASNPKAFWRLGDVSGSQPADAMSGPLKASFEDGVVFHLPGIAQGHCAHFAGGRIAAGMPENTSDYSVVFWFWNGVRHDARSVAGYLFSRGPEGDEAAAGEHLGIGGTHGDAGRLIVYNGNEKMALLAGKRELGVKKWHHVCFVRRGNEVVVHLDGREEIRGELESTHGGSLDMFFGGRNDNFSNLEGRLDEVAFFDRVLSGKEIRGIYAASAPMDCPPSSPEETLKQCHVRDGFTLELVAAEPLVMDPVAVDWAEDGSVFVAEMADYPYGVEGGGRVARLLDTDGDGRMDKRQEFLNDLSFPAGVMAWGKGVIVAAAPLILYAEDTDGDGKADVRETWFSGFMEGNQQLRVNGLRPGLDGWIYCASGGHHAGFGVKTVITSHKTGAKTEIGSRDFRFRPDGRIEPESGPSQFGRVRDDFGNWFGVQNALPLWHYVLPDRYLRRNPNAAAPDPRQQLRDRQPRLYPAKTTQKRFHGFDHVGRYTSACGISIYRDELLFPRVEGKTIAFTCAPFHNVVQRHVLNDAGVSFMAARADDGEIDFFASKDRWCRPVMSRTAPDGSLWIVDMYRYMIEHPDWLPPEGKEELRPHYRAGEDRGRIYRIYPSGKKPEGFPKVSLTSPNGIVRDLALRQGMRATVESSVSPEIRASILASGGDPVKAIHDPSAGIRALALRFLESDPTPPKEVFELASDPSLRVQLQLAFSAGEWPESEDAARCLVKLALDHGGDPFFRAAVLSSAATPKHFNALLTGVVPNPKADREMVRALLAMAPEDQVVDLLTSGKTPGEGRFLMAADWLRRRPEKAEAISDLLLAAETVAKDRSAATPLRAAALRLVGNRNGTASGLIHEPALTKVAIESLCESGQTEAVFSNWRKISPEIRALAIEWCIAQAASTRSLFAAMNGTVNPREVSAAQRQRLLESKDKQIGALAKTHFSFGDESRAIVVERYLPALQLNGDMERGRAHFEKACASCHQLGETGKAIGPDLRTITNKSTNDLLVAILDPSRSVEPRYLGYYATKKSETIHGMVAAETATSVIFKLPDGSESVIARGDLESIDSSGRSFMPDGLEASLDLQAMADLLTFLESSLRSHK